MNILFAFDGENPINPTRPFDVFAHDFDERFG